jgi:hypothetical protein
MDIIDKLKKEKKDQSVFDELIKKKEEKKQLEQERPPDILVREIKQEGPPRSEPPPPDIDEPEHARPVREFRADGLREFDIDSLGTSSDANIKIEYKSMISKMIDENKIDDAIELLKELKQRLAEQK